MPECGLFFCLQIKRKNPPENKKTVLRDFTEGGNKSR